MTIREMEIEMEVISQIIIKLSHDVSKLKFKIAVEKDHLANSGGN